MELKKADASELSEIAGRGEELENLLKCMQTEAIPAIAVWQAQATKADDFSSALKLATHCALLGAAVLRGAIEDVDTKEKDSIASAVEAEGQEGMTASADTTQTQQLIWDRASEAVFTYMSATSFVIAWNNDAHREDGLSERITGRPLGNSSGLATLPLHEVFLNHAMLNGWVVRWAGKVAPSRRDALLTLLPEVAFKKKPVVTSKREWMGVEGGALLSWKAVPCAPPMAELTTNTSAHTTHPYKNAIETLEVHRIRGAESLELRFDRQTSTEKDHDFVRIYQGDDFHTLLFWHSGDATSCWPGTAGVEPLVVPGDAFGVAFNSDIADASWGWEITARASVPRHLVAELRKEIDPELHPEVRTALGLATLPVGLRWEVADAPPRSGVELDNEKLSDALTRSKEFLESELRALGVTSEAISHNSYIRVGDTYLCPAPIPEDHVLETALAEARLDVHVAMALLTPQYVLEHPERYSPGYYRSVSSSGSTDGGVRVNLQSAEVYLANADGKTRMYMPVPPRVAGNADFQHIFGSGQKYVVEYDHHAHCQQLELAHEDTIYHVSAWRTLSSSASGGATVLTYAQRPLSIHAQATELMRTYQDEKQLLLDLQREHFEDCIRRAEGDDDMLEQLLAEAQAAHVPPPAMHVPGEEPEAVAALSKIEAWGLPRKVSSRVVFASEVYTQYVRSSLGWVSQLVEEAVDGALDELSTGVRSPRIFVSQATLAAPQECWSIQRLDARTASSTVAPARLLLYLMPQGTEEKHRRGNPGNWYELVALHDRRVLLVFELQVLGRRMQRRLAYASDARFALGGCTRDGTTLELPQQVKSRLRPWTGGTRHATGEIFGGVCAPNGAPLIPGNAESWEAAIGSLTIHRKRTEASLAWAKLEYGDDARDPEENWNMESSATVEDRDVAAQASRRMQLNGASDAFEEYIPPWALAGLIPTCLLEEYDIWRVGDTVLRGYKKQGGAAATESLHIRLVGDPQPTDGEAHHRPVSALGPLKLLRVDLGGQRQFVLANVSDVSNGRLAVHADGSTPLMCHLSPCAPVTLSAEDRHAADIPVDAAFFVFAYPLQSDAQGAGEAQGRGKKTPQLARQRSYRHTTLDFFLSLGGYVYIDAAKESVVAVRSLARGPGLSFGRTLLADYQSGSVPLRASLWGSGRMVVPTLHDVLACGVRRFCWLAPNEQIPGVDATVGADLWPHGAFVYLYDENEARFDCLFRVVKASRHAAFDSSATVATTARGGSGVRLPQAHGSIAVQYNLEPTPPCFAVVRRLSRESGGHKKLVCETLMNVAAAAQHSHMGRLADVLSRIDHLSHVLVWARGDARPGEAVAASLIEMPRLALRFRAEGGRLWSLDHDGCFVSDRAVTQNAALREQLRVLDTSLVLENEQREIFLLVPNYGVRRPVIKACPMSTVLVSDRSMKGWRAHVKATHYKLQLHPSGAFLLTSSLSSAMYLLAIRLLKREYTLAARLIPSVLSDVPFVNDEIWVKTLFGQITDDPHPDAIALRLRIGLQCAECHELPPFGGGGDERALTKTTELEGLRQHRYGVMRKDFDAYIYKWKAVSTACRLTVEQEWRLVKLLNHQKRLRFLERLRKCASKPRHGNHLTHYHVSLMEPRIGGKELMELVRRKVGGGTDGPEDKVWDNENGGSRVRDLMLSTSSRAAAGSRQEGPGFTYERTGRVRAYGSDAWACVDNVLNEQLRDGGKYGWLFLYDLMTGVIGLSITRSGTGVDQEYDDTEPIDDEDEVAAEAHAPAAEEPTSTPGAPSATAPPANSTSTAPGAASRQVETKPVEVDRRALDEWKQIDMTGCAFA